ncbi:hypothetical protein [Psychrobacillus sp.]|uniref:hypothetical protein n=1 Tax=Psychrobacillus sp. TaxID=1871623 RepID=UPI0028BEAFEC|nr:hypothetical protein [Psychrobacillus sp.]
MKKCYVQFLMINGDKITIEEKHPETIPGYKDLLISGKLGFAPYGEKFINLTNVLTVEFFEEEVSKEVVSII